MNTMSGIDKLLKRMNATAEESFRQMDQEVAEAIGLTPEAGVVMIPNRKKVYHVRDKHGVVVTITVELGAVTHKAKS